jgi:cytochrome c oxidase cbb3-type subunit 3
MADNKDKNQEDVLIQDHNYDGIREYDNPMPGWWLWILYASILFAPIYILGVHFMGFIPTYQDDLAAGQAEIQAVREAWEQANPSFEATNENLAAFVGNSEAIDAGAAQYAVTCASCHGQAGEGLIGPNLTDEFWIHGFEDADIYRVITEGVLEKGMAPWGSILSPEQRAQLVAYVRSLEGTNPTGAKEPQGVPKEESQTTDSDGQAT